MVARATWSRDWGCHCSLPTKELSWLRKASWLRPNESEPRGCVCDTWAGPTNELGAGEPNEIGANDDRVRGDGVTEGRVTDGGVCEAGVIDDGATEEGTTQDGVVENGATKDRADGEAKEHWTSDGDKA